MWFKNFRHKKMQMLMIFLIIMLCSVLLSAAVSILISLDKPFREFAKECESPTAVLFTYSDKEEDIISLGEQFAALEEIERVEYIRFHYITEELTFEGKKIEGFMKLTEYSNAVYGKIRYLEGDKKVTQNLGANECVIPACISNESKIKSGDKIKLQRAGEELIYTVRGVYSDPYNTSTAFDSDILVKEVPESLVTKLRIRLYGKDGITGSRIEEAYREKHDGQMNAEIQTLEDMIDNSLITGHIIGAVFLAIGIIMLFVSGLIIHFMIRNVMITDAKTIAVYKTMGYTSGDILKMYITFYFSVVSIACVIGIASSVFVSNRILSNVFENMGQVATNNILLPGILCYILIVSFVIGIIYIIIGKTKKVKPVYALNGMSNSSTKKKKKYKGNSKIQFSAPGIAIRTLARNKKSAVSILLTTIVTIFSVNFAIISLDVAYSMKDNNDYWLGVDRCDVMIGVPDTEQFLSVQKLMEEDDRVDFLLKNNLDSKVTMKWEKGMNTTVMYGFVYDDFSQTKLSVIEGRNPKEGDEIAITNKIAKERKKEVGDYIEVYLGGEKKVNLMITGLYQTYYSLGDACRLTSEVYTENDYDFEYNNISIYLKEQINRTDFMMDIKEKIGGSGAVIERTEAFSSIMNMIVNPQKGAIPPAAVLILLIGGINIFCIVMLKNTSSEKTNGIYKCIGYSTGHLVLSNLYYIGLVAVASIAVAIPMIIMLYPTIMKMCLGMFGFQEYPVSYKVLHILLANLGVLFIFILSTLISSRSLRKVNVRDLVQE